MIIGEIVGTIISTQKDEGLIYPLKLVQVYDYKGNAENKFIVVLDPVGAGYKERVLVSQGSATRQTLETDNKPVDALIIGIIDLIEENGEIIYNK